MPQRDYLSAIQIFYFLTNLINFLYTDTYENRNYEKYI